MSGFHGRDVGAAREDFKFGVERFADIKRTAMVGESGGNTAWQRSASRSQKRRFDTSIMPTPLRRGSGWPKHSGLNLIQCRNVRGLSITTTSPRVAKSAGLLMTGE